MGISIRAYAKLRGVSDKAVRKAIETGRIKAAQLPDKSIDPQLADELWERNTDAVQRRGKEAARAAETQKNFQARRADPGPQSGSAPVDTGSAPETADPQPVVDEKTNRSAVDNVVQLRLADHLKANRDKSAGRPSWGAGGDGGETDSPEMVELNAEEKAEKIRKLRLANDKEERRLIDREAALAHVFAVFKGSTEAWERWPDRIGNELADKWGVSDVHGFLLHLKDLVRDELNEQAGTKDAFKL